MKPKPRVVYEEHYSDNSDRYRGDLSPHNQPVKSPSPDKKSSNIIVCTRSPELQDMKQYHIDGREYLTYSLHHSRQHIREKPFPMNTPSKNETGHNVYKIEETQPTASDGRHASPHSNSRVRNTRIEIVAESTPEEFDARHSISRIREMNRSDSMELDYIKLLKSKEETIKELKEIIEMIKKNNTSVEEVEDEGDKFRELRQKNHELNGEVRELKIENQLMLNVIEKSKKSKGPHIKEEILQREIRQLKDSLRCKDQELGEISAGLDRKQSNQSEELRRLENQNDALLRMLKEKEESLASSSLSVKSTDKEKLSLIKIKQQYNENLKLMRDNFYAEMQELEGTYRQELEELFKKIDFLNSKVTHLEHYRAQMVREQDKLKVREEYHKEKERHQEIESLMLEKYSKYESQINEQKRTNDRLIQELIKANKLVEELGQKARLAQQEANRNDQLSNSQEEMGKLVDERNDLKARVNALEIDNLTLRKQFEEFGTRKGQEVSDLEKKIELILMEYEHHEKEERSSFDETISRLRNELQQSDSKEKELIDYYERDKTDTEQKVKMAIDIYNRENQTLKVAIGQKNNELQHQGHELERVRHELERLREEHSGCGGQPVNQEELERVARECNELRIRCQGLEQGAGQMTNELIQMNNLLKERDERLMRMHGALSALEEEKEGQARKMAQTEINNNDLTVRSSRKELEAIELGKKVELLERDLSNNGQNYNQALNSLRQELAGLQQKNHQLGAQLADQNRELQNRVALVGRLQQDLKNEIERKIYQGEPLEEDLHQLKRLVCECFSGNSTSSEKEIVQEFYKLNHNYQVKLEENLRVMKELDEVKGQFAEQERQRQILVEKVALLEQNNTIYERELKERRGLYDQLLQEKSRIEREILMAKKIKVEQSQIDNNHKVNVSEITSRIDRLLEMEKQRSHQVRNSAERRRVSPARQ